MSNKHNYEINIPLYLYHFELQLQCNQYRRISLFSVKSLPINFFPYAYCSFIFFPTAMPLVKVFSFPGSTRTFFSLQALVFFFRIIKFLGCI